MKCRICGSQIETYENVKNVEVDANVLYEKYKDTRKADLKFFKCPVCSHMQIENCVSEKLYEDYNLLNFRGEKDNKSKDISNGGEAVRRRTYYCSVIENLKNYAIDCEKILDIGCGQGTILNYAKEVFRTCIGVEPSKKESEIAQKNGIQVINAFFDEAFSYKNFSAFICTQVFEHLDNPVETMVKAFSVLKENGVGYVDVPNGVGIYKKNQYYDLMAEHVNYYTVQSLAKLICESGLEIISIGEVLNGYHIGAYVRKRIRVNDFETQKKIDEEKFNSFLNKNENVALWGAGIKGRNMIKLLKHADRVKYIFDSNRGMEGHFMGNVNIPMTYPDKMKVHECNTIIVMAMEYFDEIKKDLIDKYQYSGNVMSIEDLCR